MNSPKFKKLIQGAKRVRLKKGEKERMRNSLVRGARIPEGKSHAARVKTAK